MAANATGNPETREWGGGQTAFYAADTIVPFPLIERAEGIAMWDDQGRRYIDVSSGPVVSNIGHGNAHVADAMARQAKVLDYAFPRQVRNRPNIDFAERLARLAGPGFERVHLSSGGSEANESAIKFLRQYAIATGKPEKTKIVTRDPSYHGGTIANLAMNGEVMMLPFLEGFAEPSAKVPAPFTYRLPENHDAESYARHCAEVLEQTIQALGPQNVLAFVMEPVGGLSTGCIVPSADYMRRVRAICTRHGVHLVFDEVLCGMGRTGKFLAAHHWPDALPDIVTKAKGLGSGYSPLGAMLAPAEMVDELSRLTGFEFQYSYNANPISCAAGMAVLDEYERLGLTDKAASMGKDLRNGLERLKTTCPIVGDVRGMGMLYAVELVADQATKAPLPTTCKAADRARTHGPDNGLLIYSRPTSGGRYGDWFTVSPPLTITEAECDDMLQRLEATLVAFQVELTRAGVL